jgi:hypothetical protein
MWKQMFIDREMDRRNEVNACNRKLFCLSKRRS